jgi:hypothetical protein
VDSLGFADEAHEECLRAYHRVATCVWGCVATHWPQRVQTPSESSRATERMHGRARAGLAATRFSQRAQWFAAAGYSACGFSELTHRSNAGVEASGSGSPHGGDEGDGEGGRQIQFLAGNPRVEQLRGTIRLFRQMSPAALAAAGEAETSTSAASPSTAKPASALEQLPVTPEHRLGFSRGVNLLPS